MARGQDTNAKTHDVKSEKITEDQGIIMTGYTGIMCCPMDRFHKDAEKRLGEPILAREMATPEFWEKMKRLYRDDFLELLPTGEGDS